MGVVSLCLSCRDASTGMQHGLLRSTCELDLRANFDPGFSRPPCALGLLLLDTFYCGEEDDDDMKEWDWRKNSMCL